MVLQIYQEFFRGELVEWCKPVTSNFAVQRLLEKADHAGQATALLDELAPCFPQLVEYHRPGVVLKVLEMCGRLNVGQKAVFKALCGAIELGPEGQVVPSLMSWGAHEAGGDNLH